MKRDRNIGNIENVKKLIRQGTNPLVAIFEYYHSSSLQPHYKQMDSIEAVSGNPHYEQVDVINSRDRENCICFCETDDMDKLAS